MPRTSFSDWLRNRLQDALEADRLATVCRWLEDRVDDTIPDATTVALMISRAGPEGVTLSELRRKIQLPSDVLDQFLKGLSGSGQVVLSKVDGRLVYRAGV